MTVGQVRLRPPRRQERIVMFSSHVLGTLPLLSPVAPALVDQKLGVKHVKPYSGQVFCLDKISRVSDQNGIS